ncbi:Uncharacterised protein [Vibrio cholerae]|nr:Uncharacterised protein [Vibrio cholerae]CSI86925.1 Uncharacterised protein [Vibrio cholerae]
MLNQTWVVDARNDRDIALLTIFHCGRVQTRAHNEISSRRNRFIHLRCREYSACANQQVWIRLTHDANRFRGRSGAESDFCTRQTVFNQHFGQWQCVGDIINRNNRDNFDRS